MTEHEHEAGSMEDPLRIVSLKRKTIPKVAVLAAGLTAAVVAVTMTSAPAQASPGYASTCSSCHTAGGSVAATPSSVTLAPGAAYTVALAFTGGSSPVGYWVSGNGASVTASDAGPVSMTAPAAAGSYTYTVWMRSGVVASTTYTITVAPVATTPPVTGAGAYPANNGHHIGQHIGQQNGHHDGHQGWFERFLSWFS